MSCKLEPAIWPRGTGQRIACFDRCQLIIAGMSNIKEVHGKTRLDVSFLEYGRHVGQPRHCRGRRRAYAPRSTTASQDTHEKINSWVSSGGRGQLCLRSHATAHPMILTIITSLVSRSVKFQWPPKDDTRKVLHLMIAQRI